MAITKNLLELMGGSIFVESVYGKGSRFSFEVAQRVGDPECRVGIADTAKLRAAVCLDSRAKAESLERKLSSLGVRAEEVNDFACLSEGFSHAFFDYGAHDRLPSSIPADCKLIALSQCYVDDPELPPNVLTVHSPLTSAMAAKLLDENTALHDDAAGEAGNTLKLHGARFLVVDDNDINLIIAENVLKNYGAEVDTAKSGRESLQRLAEGTYDIVFMDHMMPEMDGVEATVLIRKMPGEQFSSLPIVALTANAVGDVRTMFLENGLNDFLSKPLDLREVERVLRQWLPPGKWENTAGATQ